MKTYTRTLLVFRQFIITVARCGILLGLIGGLATGSGLGKTGESGRIIVGAKPFPEGHLLAEIMASLIERQTNLRVIRRFELGGTSLCFAALQAGEIDLYPEYTGTGLIAILKESATQDPEATYQHVKQAFLTRYQLRWLDPFGFNNTYALAVRADDPDTERLNNISDLHTTSTLRAGFTREFLQREDGYPGLRRHYGLHFPSVQGLEHGLAYKAIQQKQIDILDAYSTDGKLDVYHLKLLNDDQKFFPPYYAAPLVREATLQRYPEFRAPLGSLKGTISEATMRSLNYQVEQAHRPFESVAQEFLQNSGLIGGAATDASPRSTSFPKFLWERRQQTLRLTLRHLQLTGLSALLATLIGIPIGVAISRSRRWAGPTLSGMGILQTIPSLALLGFLIPFLGIGLKPALAALFLYALLPIIQNTYAGIRSIDPSLIEAGQGIGMTASQILWRVELPMATRFILAGVRTATVINIGTATLAAFIGAGGLGEPIFTGLSLNDHFLILAGAVPAAALAVIADLFLHRFERWMTPKGLRLSR
ncbi:MAG: ABC transporter permease subunit [Acidobacteria bacterium]|nr:ABC transporter permease subunit [Acidobacteriota bacterium]MBI3655699.1 ABC transporter permease subunit [Acidobacteriota bacterium]